MRDLIYRQDVLDVIKRLMGDSELSRTVQTGLHILPSAQPEIIRCKDCKFWKKYGYINGKPEFLPKCGFNQIYTSKDDFCSRAERKNNG